MNEETGSKENHLAETVYLCTSISQLSVMKEDSNAYSVKKMYAAVVVTALVVLMLCAGVYWLFLRNNGGGATADGDGQEAVSDTCVVVDEEACPDDEEVCVEEDDDPVSQFLRVMDAGESVWRHDDFVGDQQRVTFIYFYPTAEGLGRMSYIYFNDDQTKYYRDHSYSGSYEVQGSEIAAIMQCYFQGRTTEQLMHFTISEKNGSLCIYRQGETELYFHHIDTAIEDPYRKYSKGEE